MYPNDSAAQSLIFPPPRAAVKVNEPFAFDEQVVILVPAKPTANDLFLARMLAADLTDRFRLAVRTESANTLPPKSRTRGKRVVVMGTWRNPLVAKLLARRGLTVTARQPGAEGYLLDIAPDAVLIAGSDASGALYGLQSLRYLLWGREPQLRVPGLRVYDWPRKAFRGIRLFMPGRDDLTFFRRFVRDFALLFKYNRLIIEMNAAMRLDRHPELNAGWVELARNLIYTRRDRPEGPGRQFQNSTHHDTGDFGIVEKDDMAGIVDYAREHGLDVYPEIPSLTHSYYILSRHREFAEMTKAEWPDTWCPRIPAVYRVYFDVLDEYADVMRPRTVHIGHDEWRMPVGACPRCRGRDYGALYAGDVKKIHAYLREKGIRTAMWGDHLLETVTGHQFEDRISPSGFRYRKPGAMSPKQVGGLPKDILIFNWSWDKSLGGVGNDRQLSEWGFEQVYGNFSLGIAPQDYRERSEIKGVLGGAPSSWVRTDAYNFGKDELTAFVGCSALLWSDQWVDRPGVVRLIEELKPGLRRTFGGGYLPAEDGEPVTTLDITQARNASAEALGLEAQAEKGISPLRLRGLSPFSPRESTVGAGLRTFDFAPPTDNSAPLAIAAWISGATTALPRESSPVSVGEDVSSILFLHACAKPAIKEPGHRTIYNFPDTADLLGWYEIVYEDGFVATEPLRYGVNIAEWTWGRDGAPATVCPGADAINCAREGAPPLTFFAHEWLNPRFGKVVKEVRLKATSGFVNCRGKTLGDNAIALLAVSIVKRHPSPPSAPGEEVIG